MRINQLSITNLGVYRGLNTFDLSPQNGNIVLFGGKNGAGKTTLLNSLRLCFYSEKAFPNKKSKTEYLTHIDNLIHKNKIGNVKISKASVEVIFEFSQAGVRNTFTIIRSWVRTKSKEKILEQLLLKKNGIVFSELPEASWQSFVEDLIPLHLFNLFFFDGENINNLILESMNSSEFKTEIKKMLGLETIQKLHEDLQTYLRQQLKEKSSVTDNANLEKCGKIRDSIEKEIQVQMQEKSKIQSSLGYFSGEVERLENKISKESNGYALEWAKIQSELRHAEAQKIEIKSQIIELSETPLPFSFIPELLSQLKDQLDKETQWQQWNYSQSILSEFIENVNQELSSEGFWSDILLLNPDGKNKLQSKLSLKFNDLTSTPKNISDIDQIHGFSESEKNQLFQWFSLATSTLPEKSKQLTSKYVTVSQQIKQFSRSIENIPSDDIIRPFINERNQNLIRIGELKAEGQITENNLNRLRFEYSTAQRDLENAYKHIQDETKLNLRVQQINTAIIALEEFNTIQTQRKLRALEELFIKRLIELNRKNDLIKTVHFDERSLSITLVGSQDDVIPLDSLSAGEQQIFAIALLWALRQLSGQPFPVVIDTPLGRLDREHRDKLINQYFPNVSHQVLLFSTDTEVNQKYFNDLKPNISHSYHLSYDSDYGGTIPEKGYFRDMEADNAIITN
jgi:DNA sulfur modification protein DndD